MKQQVFIVGRELGAMVPYSFAFAGNGYSVTLVQTERPVERTAALAAQHRAWYLLLFDTDEEAAEFQRRAEVPELASLVTDGSEEPVVAVAQLIAMAHWETAPAGAAEVRETEEQHG